MTIIVKVCDLFPQKYFHVVASETTASRNLAYMAQRQQIAENKAPQIPTIQARLPRTQP